MLSGVGKTATHGVPALYGAAAAYLNDLNRLNNEPGPAIKSRTSW
jgi:hypothetical protein